MPLDNATQPDLGAGPYGVELDAEYGFYYLTRDGARLETGKAYPLGKTAYRAARQLNAAADPVIPEAPKADKRVTVSPDTRKDRPAAPRAHDAPRSDEGLKAEAIFSGTREEWLNAFVAKARVEFKQRGHELPEKVRVSIGFMFRGGKAIGQCWHAEASSDGTREIFIIPTLDDSKVIGAVLTHELCHTLFPGAEKHGKNFKKAFYGVGMTGKATQCASGPEWDAWALPILAELGPIPHAAIDPSGSGIKKQSTRLLKVKCEDCGFTFRVTAKWVNGRSLQCPDDACGGVAAVAGGEDGE